MVVQTALNSQWAFHHIKKVLIMKNVIFGLLFGLLFILGCKKKNVEPLYGTISSFNVDGKPFKREGVQLQILGYDETKRCKISQYGIIMLFRSYKDTLVEQIGFHQIPMFKIGIIPIPDSKDRASCDSLPTATFGMTRHEDLFVAGFSVLKNFDNYLDVESFDKNTKEVKGKFKLTLIVNDYPEYHKALGYRDTVVFESGFAVKLQ